MVISSSIGANDSSIVLWVCPVSWHQTMMAMMMRMKVKMKMKMRNTFSSGCCQLHTVHSWFLHPSIHQFGHSFVCSALLWERLALIHATTSQPENFLSLPVAVEVLLAAVHLLCMRLLRDTTKKRKNKKRDNKQQLSSVYCWRKGNTACCVATAWFSLNLLNF